MNRLDQPCTKVVSQVLLTMSRLIDYLQKWTSTNYLLGKKVDSLVGYTLKVRNGRGGQSVIDSHLIRGYLRLIDQQKCAGKKMTIRNFM
jgi:hypothetical protein